MTYAIRKPAGRADFLKNVPFPLDDSAEGSLEVIEHGHVGHATCGYRGMVCRDSLRHPVGSEERGGVSGAKRLNVAQIQSVLGVLHHLPKLLDQFVLLRKLAILLRKPAVPLLESGCKSPDVVIMACELCQQPVVPLIGLLAGRFRFPHHALECLCKPYQFLRCHVTVRFVKRPRGIFSEVFLRFGEQTFDVFFEQGNVAYDQSFGLHAVISVDYAV